MIKVSLISKQLLLVDTFNFVNYGIKVSHYYNRVLIVIH